MGMQTKSKRDLLNDDAKTTRRAKYDPAFGVKTDLPED
jgi:hypothetical protein